MRNMVEIFGERILKYIKLEMEYLYSVSEDTSLSDAQRDRALSKWYILDDIKIDLENEVY